MKENWDSLKDDPGNCVAAISEPTRMYRMKYGCMIDQNGSMRRLVDATGKKVQLASEVTNIEEGAFDGVENVATLLMPKTEKYRARRKLFPKQRDPEDSDAIQSYSTGWCRNS